MRGSSVEPPRVSDTALFRGALLEIAKKDREIERLRGLLRDAGIDADEAA